MRPQNDRGKTANKKSGSAVEHFRRSLNKKHRRQNKRMNWCAGHAPHRRIKREDKLLLQRAYVGDGRLDLSVCQFALACRHLAFTFGDRSDQVCIRCTHNRRVLE